MSAVLPEGRYRPRYQDSVRCALLGGAGLGAALLTFETVLAAMTDRRLTHLGWSPFIGWLAGAALGAVAGLAAARMTPLRPAGADRFSRFGPWLAVLGLAGILLVHLHDRSPQPFFAVGPLAISVAILVLAVGPLRLVGRRGLTARFRLWPSGPSQQALALGAALAVAALSSALSALPARLDPVVWRPAGSRHPVAAAGLASRRLLMVGLDGARWETLEPLLEAGRMPHLASLARRGVRGVLRSSGEEGVSPIAWTSIFTGQPPEVHGVTGWDRAFSSRRQVPALWSILRERSWVVNVVNVVGAYPAEVAGGGVLAGGPAPGSILNYPGWLVTDSPSASRRAPVAVEPPAALQRGGWRRIAVGPIAPGSALESSSAYRLLHRLHRRMALRLARFAGPSLSLEIAAGGGSSDPPRLRVRGRGDERPLFEGTAGSWSRWLSVTAGPHEYRFRIYVVAAGASRPELFLTALHRGDLPGASSPNGLLSWLEAAGEPLPIETMGWTISVDGRLLAPLAEYTLDLARARFGATGRLMDFFPWDASIHVATAPDRLQHAYWRFREPERYLSLLGAQPPRLRLGRKVGLKDLELIRAGTPRFSEMIGRGWEAHDAGLGELLERSGKETLVVVVSDHGAEGGLNPIVPWAGKHHPDGIYLLAGPTIAARETRGPPLDQVDIVPLVLDHLGLPRALDLDGTVPEALRPRAADGTPLPLPLPVPTFGRSRRDDPRSAPRGLSDEELLRSLGYVG